MTDKRTFLFEVNVTRDCNIRCSHCYISSDKKAASKFMTRDQFIELMQQIYDFMRSEKGQQQYNHADIHIIGGEPCMLGTSFYEDVLPETHKIFEDLDQHVSLRLVSNLLHKDTMDIVPMFSQVSTSYEVGTRFPKEALHKRWEERVGIISDMANVDFSVTGAITKQTIDYGAEKLMEYFRDLNLKQIHMGFFIPSGDGLINQLLVFPDFEDTAEYLIQLTDYYLKAREVDNDLVINPCESLINSIYHDIPSDDIICPIIPGSLDFDWNGNTVTCIEAGGEIDCDYIGNVFEIPITDLLKTDEYQRQRLLAVTPKRICRSCDEYAVCQAACNVLHNYWDGNGECPGFKRWIKYVRNLVEVQGILPKYEKSSAYGVEAYG